MRDQFTAKKRHRYAIRYHFAPDCEATVVTGGGGARVEARHASGATLTIRVICETELQIRDRRRALSDQKAGSRPVTRNTPRRPSPCSKPKAWGRRSF